MGEAHWKPAHGTQGLQWKPAHRERGSRHRASKGPGTRHTATDEAGTEGQAQAQLIGSWRAAPPALPPCSTCTLQSVPPGSFSDAQNRHNQNILRTYPSSTSLKYALPLLVCALSILLCPKVIFQRQGGHYDVSTNLTYSKLISLRKEILAADPYTSHSFALCVLCLKHHKMSDLHVQCPTDSLL